MITTCERCGKPLVSTSDSEQTCLTCRMTERVKAVNESTMKLFGHQIIEAHSEIERLTAENVQLKGEIKILKFLIAEYEKRKSLCCSCSRKGFECMGFVETVIECPSYQRQVEENK
jgi:hypothetical protein